MYSAIRSDANTCSYANIRCHANFRSTFKIRCFVNFRYHVKTGSHVDIRCSVKIRSRVKTGSCVKICSSNMLRSVVMLNSGLILKSAGMLNAAVLWAKVRYVKSLCAERCELRSFSSDVRSSGSSLNSTSTKNQGIIIILYSACPQPIRGTLVAPRVAYSPIAVQSFWNKLRLNGNNNYRNHNKYKGEKEQPLKP